MVRASESQAASQEKELMASAMFDDPMSMRKSSFGGLSPVNTALGKRRRKAHS